MRLVFAGHRCVSHSPSSGYDQVCELFPTAGWLSGPELSAGELVWRRRPAREWVPDHPDLTFHVFYGDCSGRQLPAILRERFPQATIISTVHQPVDRLLADPPALASLFAVDGVIAVAQAQALQLAASGVEAAVHAVPHGVWTRRFRPGRPTGQTEDTPVLMVGRVLRDWAGARQILERLGAAGAHSVVLGAEATDHVSGLGPLVTTIAWMTEDDLVQIYRSCAALVLPVVDATASNALLEAMACGCPVVSPNLPALVEYLGDATDAYPPGRYDVAAATVLDYIRDPARRRTRGRQLARRAARLDWKRIQPRLEAVYRLHQGQGSRSTAR